MAVTKPVESAARYYEEVLVSLNELRALLQDNNMMLKELVTTLHDDHKVNLGIHDNIRKIRFNTQ